MYLHEPTYNIDELVRCNYHIHSDFSRCAKREMTLPSIIEAAQKAGLKEIAITDHIGPGEAAKMRRNLSVLKKRLAECEHTVKVYIGAELSAYGVNKYSMKYSEVPFEYRLYSHNHYHVDGWEQPTGHTPEDYKEHSKAVLESIIKSGKCDCLAHPFCDKYTVREFEDSYGLTPCCITRTWSDNEIGDILTLGKEFECAWELNAGAVNYDPVFSKRYFNIGREVGVCFNIGTDAHTLKAIDTSEFAVRLKELLF